MTNTPQPKGEQTELRHLIAATIAGAPFPSERSYKKADNIIALFQEHMLAPTQQSIGDDSPRPSSGDAELLEEVTKVLLKWHNAEPHAYLEAAEIVKIFQRYAAQKVREALL